MISLRTLLYCLSASALAQQIPQAQPRDVANPLDSDLLKRQAANASTTSTNTRTVVVVSTTSVEVSPSSSTALVLSTSTATAVASTSPAATSAAGSTSVAAAPSSTTTLVVASTPASVAQSSSVAVVASSTGMYRRALFVLFAPAHTSTPAHAHAPTPAQPRPFPSLSTFAQLEEDVFSLFVLESSLHSRSQARSHALPFLLRCASPTSWISVAMLWPATLQDHFCHELLGDDNILGDLLSSG